LLTAANQPGYASLTPHQIVPKLDITWLPTTVKGRHLSG
jgi:hypothetical protein